MKKILKILLSVVLALVLVVVIFVGSIYFYVKEDSTTPGAASIDTIRQLENGEVIGFEDENGTYAWLGIPYAEPPLAQLRWKAPRAKRPWTGRHEALNYGSDCAQGSVGSEDCLYLNVWSPDGQGDSKPLPVMFWIHGGGNTSGSGRSVSYRGAEMAGRHDVVVVTINYRLGPFGWFRHPALSSDSHLDDSGNYGTLDIIQALQWLRDNIHAFGGDPGNVTIFGESAGGFNVLTMLASPLAEGLFHQAIVQSGGLDITPVAVAENYRDDDTAGSAQSSREAVNNLLVIDGTAVNRKAAKAHQETMSSDEVALYILGKSTDQIIAAHQYQPVIEGYKETKNSGSLDILGDGFVLPKGMSNAEIFSDITNYNAVPIILGTNRDEGTFFGIFDDNYVDLAFGFVPVGIKDEAGYARMTRYASDLWKLDGVDSLASLMNDAQEEGVFAYRFDVDDLHDLGFVDLQTLLGASHGMEVPFVFGNLSNSMKIYYQGLMTPDVARVSDSMMSYWAQFAYAGDPGSGRSGNEVAWTSWQNGDATKKRLMVFDSDLDQGIRMSSDRVTAASLKARFFADKSFSNQQLYCETYLAFFPNNRSGSKENLYVASEYANLGTGGCAP